ncbi:MAG: succinate--CoA ligase subunit beta [Bdellovibrionales bacterium RIFCSPHIGHO2_01_FULL_40_29]|nr:MAG: succinate--CoA ligase subunit beta [Bdellovibrionales bacterium RIFCSPHIGHO2_01_FULL_40_29]OFZ34747.1 MAG: succinate--CoA ligase subunit beta [Bdellovibrionales bacterium RIFCSPHIGHO2_02_FULL_40_15]
MNIHEYQAKEVLRKFNVATLKGKVANSPDEAVAAAKEIGGALWVVKAQIHAGGRGKGGGVKLAKTLDEVHSLAAQMLGMTLITHQTGPEGKVVNKIFVESGCNIAKEYYVACLIDRVTGRVAMMASSEGGVDIEEVAEHNPGAIKKVDIDPVIGLGAWQARELAFAIGMSPDVVNKATKFFMGLYQAFISCDCSIAEINPLVVTKENDVICLDAKMNFDSNALYRQPAILELRDLNEEDPTEIEASKFDLAFIKLDGTIGCLVNGAGLAMATLDIIKLHGATPANFLDVGGGANKEKVTNAFKIILKDPNVKGILVNIFGGIMKCDVIAEGVIAASKEVGLTVPLVVRLEGTNVELGKKILKDSGLNIIPANDLTDAAQKITAAIKA